MYWTLYTMFHLKLVFYFKGPEQQFKKDVLTLFLIYHRCINAYLGYNLLIICTIVHMYICIYNELYKYIYMCYYDHTLDYKYIYYLQKFLCVTL